MEWDKKIPLGRQDLQDWRPRLNEVWSLDICFAPVKEAFVKDVNISQSNDLTPDKQAPRLTGQAG